MSEHSAEKNIVKLIGHIASDFKFVHRLANINFYMCYVGVRRLSGYVDYIPLLLSEHIVDVNQSSLNQFVLIEGSYRSHNEKIGERRKLILYVYVNRMQAVNKREQCNRITLGGNICKEPIFRNTPLGRQIADLMLAVNRNSENQITFHASAGKEMLTMLLN